MSHLPPVHEKQINPLKAALLAPFSARYRRQHAQRHLPVEEQAFLRHSIMTGDRAFLLAKNSKAACTTLAQMLVEYSTGRPLADEHQAHRPQPGMFYGFDGLHWRELHAAWHRLPGGGEPVRFSCVRHPLGRFVSCYRYFFEKKARPGLRHLKPLESRGFDPSGDRTRNMEIFADYVAEAIAEAPAICDPHFREQNRNVGHGLVELDVLGRVEDFTAFLEELFERAGRPELMDRLQSIRLSFNRTPGPPPQVSAPLRRKVRSIYERDYALFGYDD
ncbi:MAG: hypothetical protein D6832_06080 [Alphaproteobacteria bacterium]|nr:MAG: hypothetical protein D6832_06080 [Alphaproteobacteria bacterium]